MGGWVCEGLEGFEVWAGKGWVTDFGCLVIIIGLFSLCLSHFELVVCIYFNMIYIGYGNIFPHQRSC